jgi:hypothetical protein
MSDFDDLFRKARRAVDPSDDVRARVLAAVVNAGPPPGGAPPAPRSWIGGGVAALVVVAAGVGVSLSGGGTAPDAPAASPASSASSAPLATAAIVADAQAAPPAQPSAEATGPRGSSAFAGPSSGADSAFAGPLDLVPKALSTAAPRVPSASAKASADADLSDEVTLLATAKSALGAHDATRALEALDAHQTRFPKSALGQERTALRIQALCAAGRSADARPIFGRLRGSSPESPHLAAIRRACGFVEE